MAKAKGGDAEGGKPEGGRRQGRHQLSVLKGGVAEHPHIAEAKLLKAIEHREPEPGVEGRVAVCVAGVAAERVQRKPTGVALEWAGEDLRDDGD